MTVTASDAIFNRAKVTALVDEVLAVCLPKLHVSFVVMHVTQCNDLVAQLRYV